MIGIIILNYNTYYETIKCIESIIKTIDISTIRIYIIDNASQNDSLKILNEKYSLKPFIKIIISKINGGYSSGNNIGIDACLADGINYAIISNNDVIFTENAIQDMYDFISRTNNVIVVGPRIIDLNSNYQKSITLKKQSYIGFLFQNSFFESKIKELSTSNPFEVYTVSGCCFVADLKKFKEIGAFDKSTFLYNEENILGVQIEKSYYKVIYFPKTTVIHAHGGTTGKNNMLINTEFMKSSLYYWKEYRRKSVSSLLLIWLVYTIRWIIKALFSHSLRARWGIYIKESISIFKEIKNKEKRKDE